MQNRPASLKRKRKSTEKQKSDKRFKASVPYQRDAYTMRSTNSPVKSTFIITDPNLATLSPDIRKKIVAENPNLKMRDINKIIIKSPSGKASELETPGGTRLYKDTDIGAIRFFREKALAKRSHEQVLPKLKTKEAFTRSKTYQVLKQALATTKENKTRITPELLSQTAEERRRSKKKRRQAPAMTKSGKNSKNRKI